MPTSPTAPTAVPDFPAIGDASYNTKAYNWATHMDATYPTEMQALATNAYSNAVEADANATTATTKAAEAVAAASAATATANASAWVNGGTYALNANAISGVDFQTYRKKTASSVTVTDPSADATNWVKVGGGSIGLGGTTSTASITLTASSPAAMTVTPANPGLYVTLPDATTCTKADNLYAVYNAGDYDYGVKDSAGTQLGWIRARTGAMIGLADNATAAGVWAYYGLEKTGITASYVNSTLANMGSTIRRIALDANRTCFLFGGTDCYAIVYDASTQTWGSATLVRATVKSGAFVGVLSATNQVLVVSCDSTTGMRTVTLTIAGTGVTVNSPVSTTLGGGIRELDQLIAVPAASAFAVSFYRAATLTGVRAITVSGTVPTIGTEVNPGASTTGVPAMFVSGSVIRVLTNANSAIAVTPYTVSGTTLTVGTAATVTATSGYRAFLNGNGNIVCHYINGTHYATIFKLTGTTEAASSVSLGTAPTVMPSYSDYVQITASKTAFLAHAGASTWYANILTDTSGTATAGTQISGAISNNNISALAGLAIIGSTASFGIYVSSSTLSRLGFDCSSASPVLSAVQSVAYASGYSGIPVASDLYGVRQANHLIASNRNHFVASTQTSRDLSYTTNGIIQPPVMMIKQISSGAVGSTNNESFLASAFDGNNVGFLIQRIEAAA